MPRVIEEGPGETDDIDRELEKLRGFGPTLWLAFAVCAAVVALITAVLWWILF